MANTLKTAPAPASRSNQILRILLWVLIGGLSLKFIFSNVLHYYKLDAESMGRWFDYKWMLIAHISGGTLALVMGPFQFWKRFRQRNLKIHRWMGMAYLIGILVAVIASTSLSWTSAVKVDLGWAIGLQSLALAWFVTTGMAYRLIRLRRIERHREWMVRSYVVTLAFVSFRILNDYVAPSIGSSIELSTAILWVSWAIPLLVVEVVFGWNKR